MNTNEPISFDGQGFVMIGKPGHKRPAFHCADAELCEEVVNRYNQHDALCRIAEAARALEIVATKMLAGGFNGRMADMHRAIGEASEATRAALDKLKEWK